MIRRRWAWLLALPLVLSALVAGWVQHWLDRPLDLTGPQYYEVPAGASVARVAADLAELGVLDEPVLWRWWARLSGDAGSLQRGEYLVEPGVAPRSLLQMFTSGRVLRRQLTFVEGWRFSDFRAALDAAPALEHLTTDLDDMQIMARLGASARHPEGRFFPDTYDYVRGDSDLDLLGRARARMRSLLEREWAQRDPGLPLADPDEALILASLVEKETGLDADRDRIAAVFLRRLERNMPLQTDPSVIYGLGPTFDGDLRRRDLRADHPYNTYRRRGLPPTPIAMPGLASIRAALHPAETDALYFVARGDGSSEFSATLEAHNAAVRRFQIEARSEDYRSTPEPDGPGNESAEGQNDAPASDPHDGGNP